MRVNATGGGQLPGAPDELPPDEELLLDEELLEEDELPDEELLLPEEVLLEEELLVEESLPADMSPPQAASNAALASNNAEGYLRRALIARTRHNPAAPLLVLRDANCISGRSLVCNVQKYCAGIPVFLATRVVTAICTVSSTKAAKFASPRSAIIVKVPLDSRAKSDDSWEQN